MGKGGGGGRRDDDYARDSVFRVVETGGECIYREEFRL